MMKRLLCCVLVAVLLLAAVPAAAFAAEPSGEEILEQRRKIALDYMYQMATVIWRATEDIDYGAVTKKDPDDVAIGISRLNLVKGRLYQGVPYSYAGSTGEAFMEFATDEDGDGVYEVEGLSWRALNGNSTYGARIGNDCSGAIDQAWGLFGSSNRFATTHFWNEANGFLKVGDFNDYGVYDYREYYSTNGTQGTYGICEENGKDVIVAAYAHLMPADSVVHCKSGGHVMMITDVDVKYKNGKVDPDASTVKVTHQTKTYSNAGKQAHYFHEGLQEEVYQILGLDDVFTFSKLFSQGYLPMTCKELRDPAPIPEAYVTDSVTNPSADTVVDGIISSNRIIDSVTMTISDATGKQLQQGRVTPKRGNNYAFNMRQFVDDEYYTMRGYVNPYALPAGKYHCKVVCRLSNGQTFTMRDFDYDWTPIEERTVAHTGTTCPMCGASAITWKALPGDLSATKQLNGANQHYYLDRDISNNAVYHLEEAGSTVCLDLNDHNITSTARVFVTNTDTTLRIMGSGILSGGAGTDYQGSVLDVYGRVILHGGTYQLATPVEFPVVSTRGFYARVDMYDDATIRGIEGATYSSVLMTRGVFNMHGGVVTGGNSSGHGGNFHIGYKTGTKTDGTDTYECELYMFGGVIENGKAAERGGNVYVVNEGEAHIYENALITGGSAKNGGNIEAYSGGYVTVNGATVRDGYAKDRGGNLYAYGVGKTTQIVVNDALIENGTASKAGGNVESYGGTITLNNSTIQNGKIDKTGTYGGNMDVRQGGEIILNSGIVADGKAGSLGGNIGVTLEGRFIMNGGTVRGGSATDVTKNYGKSIFLYSDGHMIMNGGTVETALSGNIGNGIYLQNKSTLTLAGDAVIAGKEGQLTEGIYVQSEDSRLLVDNSYTGQASVKWHKAVDQTIGATLPETAGVCGTTVDGVFVPGGDYSGILVSEAVGTGYVLGADGRLQIAETQPAPDTPENGWYQDRSDAWYYFENGAMVCAAWRKDSKGWVYLGADGAMVTEAWAADSKGLVWVGADGYMVTKKWIDDDGVWYYVGADGYRIKNKWMKDSKGWCWLTEDGSMLTNGWTKDSKGWCYVGADGYCVTQCWMQDSVGWVYLDSEGSMVYSQWILTDGKWYYVGADGYRVYNKWSKDSKGWVYVGEEGYMLTNCFAADSKGLVWVGADGYMVTNKWVKSEEIWYYMGADGYKVCNQWRKDSKGWCWLTEDGSMLKNSWLQDSVGWCYIDGNGYCLTSTSQVIDGTLYHFDANSHCTNK